MGYFLYGFFGFWFVGFRFKLEVKAQLIGGGWCRLFVDGLREGVVDAFRRSSKLLPAFEERFEIVRWQ